MKDNKKIGIVIDRLDKINQLKDSTLGLILEAQYLGYNVYTFNCLDIFFKNGNIFSLSKKIKVKKEKKLIKYQIINHNVECLENFKLILMRKNPPIINTKYDHAIRMLILLKKKNVFVSNNPESILKLNEKIFSLHFPEICPPTIISSSIKELLNFINFYKNIILKPIHGMGGKGIIKSSYKDPNLISIIEILTKNERKAIICQKFIEDIYKGDRRIFIINGKIFPYILLRKPNKNSIRANIDSGGKGKVEYINSTDIHIVNVIKNKLLKYGLHFVGIDIIGKFLIEINITSPTCARQINEEKPKKNIFLTWFKSLLLLSSLKK